MSRISLIAALAVASAIAAAQDWPTRPITMVVPFGAGGGTDVVGRMIAPHLGELLGQQVVIENLGGSGGMIGSYKVARSAPDGYQVGLAVTGTHAQNQSLYKKPLYDAATDFAPVGLIADASYILITRPDFPAGNLQEFIAYAKANGAKMQYGSAGAGSGTHITCLLLNTAIGVEVTHVPYRSTAQGMPDLLAGRIDYICEPVQTALPLIEQKSVKALATLTRDRSPPRHGARTRSHRFRWADLVCAVPSQGNSRLDCAASQPRTERYARHGRRAAAPRSHWPADCAARAAEPRIPRPVRGERNQEMGRPDQGERRVDGLME